MYRIPFAVITSRVAISAMSPFYRQMFTRRADVRAGRGLGGMGRTRAGSKSGTAIDFVSASRTVLAKREWLRLT